uniref:Uncharacterized protein n=1 Tax=Picea glauca TaxID=3330 RepID=A0A101M460_PICGL|nr:hypothetical protein ABT39_MTgene482 [Picea glauca]QHR91249.1 hypothetical protein Q903MT_gene5281 [Picea sitchensis]
MARTDGQGRYCDITQEGGFHSKKSQLPYFRYQIYSIVHPLDKSLQHGSKLARKLSGRRALHLSIFLDL